jgi:hypothetical protein
MVPTSGRAASEGEARMNATWDNVRIQHALLGAEIVSETRMTDLGPCEWYSLKLDDKIISLGTDKNFTNMLCFSLCRNAAAFEREPMK